MTQNDSKRSPSDTPLARRRWGLGRKLGLQLLLLPVLLLGAELVLRGIAYVRGAPHSGEAARERIVLAARNSGSDLVVRKGDIADENGLSVKDITADVKGRLTEVDA